MLGRTIREIESVSAAVWLKLRDVNFEFAQMSDPSVMRSMPKFPQLPPPPSPTTSVSWHSSWWNNDGTSGNVCAKHDNGQLPPPPKKQRSDKQHQHCRFFNLGDGSCHLATCNFLHVDDKNWDHHRRAYVGEKDNGYVTREQVETLRQVHAEARRHLRAKKQQETTTAAEEVAAHIPVEESVVEEKKKIVTYELLQQWLDCARSEMMKEDSVFLRDRVTLSLEGFPDKVRFPLEAAVWSTPNGNISITMHKKLHVTWSCMLYGTGKGVMQHLQSCLVLGYKLRYELKPWLAAKYNITFENVLFVTDTALEQAEFCACSFMWSMVFKDIPKVHESRLAGTSSHLIAEGTNAAHVFLKVEAFKVPAELSIISDLDVVVTRPEKLAAYIARFHRCHDRDSTILPPGGVMVMQRKLSKVTFNEPPQQISQNDWTKFHHEQGQQPVSYCWAFIRPTLELATRYEEHMQAPALTSGLLSDQDLLAEVISTDYTKANHDFIGFPSWWVHSDICSERAQEVMEGNMNNDEQIQGWRKYGETLAAKIGAFHLSKSFDFRTCAETLLMKQDSWVRSMKISKWNLHRKMVWPDSDRKVTFQNYIEVLTGLWETLQNEARQQRAALSDVIVQAIQELTPGLGLMKAMITMHNAPVYDPVWQRTYG